jgi:hypothetical protein
MLRIAVSVCWATAVLSCAKQFDSVPQKASVDGVVVDSFTRQPIRKAHVSLSSPNNTDDKISYGTTTTDDGKFSFEGLDPGQYVVSAEKLGYLGHPTHSYGSDSGERTLHLQLSAGQQFNSAELKLTPEGVITGRVVDKDGDPCEFCSIALFTYTFKNGKRQPNCLESGSDLDDRGVFRFAGLAAGK